nr:sensor histidine kinase [Hymenobacter piscis]
MRQALLRAESRAGQERQAADLIRSRTLLGLSLALAIISLLSFYLARQRRLASERAVALAQANQDLDEKVAQVELLNKEIQHRVKNNLHMVFSLLQMQERRTENAEVLEQLQAARLRVESIAALHNQLLAGRPDGPLDLSAFLKELISAVVNCLANEQHVVTHLLTEDVQLPPNGYVALSLILNEWVTNSIKYARPVGERLELTVRVRNQPGLVRIDYADNGLPPTTTAAAPEPGLGSQIIGLLSRQLGATLRTLPAHPYHYELLIPHGAEN